MLDALLLLEVGVSANALRSSRVYAADMFYSVFKDDPMDAIQGRRYRRMMLEKGASVDEMTTLVDFLGREPSAEAFYKDMGLQ